MALDKKAVKEWKAEYQLINQSERDMLSLELPLIPSRVGIERYFRLCEFLMQLSSDARDAFAEERRRHYLDMENRFRKAARYWGYDFPS